MSSSRSLATSPPRSPSRSRTSSTARAQISDANRIYPGDGVAPLKNVLRDLHALGFRGLLSLELFNRDYWKQDALLQPETRAAYRRMLDQGWTDAIAALHPGEAIYTFWDFFRNRFAVVGVGGGWGFALIRSPSLRAKRSNP